MIIYSRPAIEQNIVQLLLARIPLISIDYRWLINYTTAGPHNA